ncbi:MAG: S1 family peptidase [Waterburya sp.]
MKWLPSRGSKNYNFGGGSSPSPHLFNLTPQAKKLIICLISTGVFLSGDASKFRPETFVTAPSQGLSTQISNVATKISVKVFGQDFLGSGFMIMHQPQDNQYIVLTNQHVLRAGEAPFKIQTADGKTYSAEVVTGLITSKDTYDLALLRFQANTNYPIAKIGSSHSLEVGEPIFAAGFPHNQVDTTNLNSAIVKHSPNKNLTNFALKPGRVTIVLNQALEEGYQIGYTNDVQKGMSGGPLLNSRGEVIGINGKHAYPLWESPEIYLDGSQPCPALQDLITRSSLAIPIEKTIELTPRLESLRPTSDLEISRQSNLSLEHPNLVAKMRAEAAAITQNCENYARKSIKGQGQKYTSTPNNDK